MRSGGNRSVRVASGRNHWNGNNNWRWRHRHWGGGGYWPYVGFGTGLALGYGLGAAPYYAGDYYAGGYYAGGYAGNDAVAYCMSRFQSYDPASGTYLGYDGLRHPCP
jgi:hypothetical protein